MIRWECLQIPVGRRIRLAEAILGEEGQLRPLVPRRHNDDITLNDVPYARSASGDTLFSPVDLHAIGSELLNIASDPLGLSRPELVHDVRVNHWCVSEDALVGWRDVLQVAVEELAEEELWDPREHGLLPEYVECQQHVDNWIPRYDPLVAAGEDVYLVCTLGRGKLEGFDGTCTSSDDNHFLASRPLARQLARVMDLALEVFHAINVRNFWVPAGADGGDDALEPAIRGVVDDPSPTFVLIDVLHRCVEPGAGVQAVALPEVRYLTDDLLAVRVTALPLHRRVKAVHHGMNLQTGGVVDLAPDASQVVLRASLKDDHVETVAYAMRGSRHACDAGSYDSYFGPVQPLAGIWWVWGQYLV